MAAANCRRTGLWAAALLAGAGSLSGCASTAVTLAPSPQSPVCDGGATALVLWAPQWRPDQKEVPAREALAERGLRDFLAGRRCFGSHELRRLPVMTEAAVAAAVAGVDARTGTLVTVAVRELGPVLRLGASAALVDGGTEVKLDVAEYRLPAGVPTRRFSVHWQNGGPGVVKGVATLADDMAAALTAALQPAIDRRRPPPQ